MNATWYQTSQTRRYLIYVICAASLVYVIGHWQALTNPYVINDDVRQQIYWMHQWNDRELFQDDLLSRYARNYVPWGVQAVYYLASPFVNPVQFSKVVAGILYVVTAAFLFGLALQFRNEMAALLVVCAFFFFSTFIRKISGGLSQSFAFPLLAAYLFFLARENLWACAVVILLESVLNPYIFVLCLATHAIFLAKNYGPAIVASFRGGESTGTFGGTIRHMILVNAPIALGVALMALKYVFLEPAEFGNIVTWATMADKIEYTAEGRYAFLPGPSLIYEVIRPWILVFPVDDSSQIIGWIAGLAAAAVIVFALTRPDKNIDIRGFRVFGYLLPASFILYFMAYVLMMRLFLPRRYVEFSLNIFYCTAMGVSLGVVCDYLGLKRKSLVILVGVLVVLGAARNWNVGIYDYSRYAPLYTFLESVPKTSLIAGHPELMDNVPTFARRKAFVTYELSHTWSDKYWDVIKTRTFDLFRAYYSDDSEEIRRFGRRHGIDYLVVRDEDFPPKLMKNDKVYFEPFNGFIHRLVSTRSHFAALNGVSFPVVYSKDGIRVLKIAPTP
ncbi:MAG: hypothetical protein HY913_20415 [Desulfomonile tiedjei]|nr:hypothetical protein [Desulfomonile tiedjei]